MLISHWRLSIPEKGHVLAQATLFNKDNPCREVTTEGCLRWHFEPVREYVLHSQREWTGKGQETDNYAKMSLRQTWRYAEYYRCPEREPNSISGVLKKLSDQDDIQLESYKLKKTLTRGVVRKVIAGIMDNGGPEGSTVNRV